MPRVGRYSNAALTVDWQPDALPYGVEVEPVAVATADRSASSGLLYRPPRPARALVALMHPRVDFTRHYLIPQLLRAGVAVWAQRSRSVNNDSTTIHEQLLLDIAAAHADLEARGFERIFVLGNSGGASLYGFYVEQAGLERGRRLTSAPSGLPVDLDTEMPLPAGVILLAPHAGQGELLLHCIDPSVVDEGDPVATDRGIDLFAPENGFRPAPESSSYSEPFLRRYRERQVARVRRIDDAMRDRLERARELRRRGRDGDGEARRAALAAQYVTVHRTDADPRTVDLGLDPSERDYGSIFGRRPDVTNFGAVGFGRLTTPHAWLSTWSGLSSQASVHRTAPSIALPVLLLAYTADNSVFPGDVERIATSLGTSDLTRAGFEADHYGYAPGTEVRVDGIGDAIAEWAIARA
jgi:hypothetical protein